MRGDHGKPYPGDLPQNPGKLLDCIVIDDGGLRRSHDLVAGCSDAGLSVESQLVDETRLEVPCAAEVQKHQATVGAEEVVSRVRIAVVQLVLECV